MNEGGLEYAKIMDYIERNPAAVLSTTNGDGSPHGSVVYVVGMSHHTVCLVTKIGTQKYANIVSRPAVALTFFNEHDSSTLQASGQAYLADSPQMVDYVLDKVTKLHAMQAGWTPPVTHVPGEKYAVIGIELEHGRLSEFQGASDGRALANI